MNFIEKLQKPFEITNNTLEDHEERISRIEERLKELEEKLNNVVVTANESILKLVKLINEVKENRKVATA